MKPSWEERETVVNYGRLDDTATVYTTDERVMTKLDRYVKNGTDWEFVGSEMHEGDIVSKTYRCPVSLISFRSKKVTGRKLSEEEKKEKAELFRRYRQSQNQF